MRGHLPLPGQLRNALVASGGVKYRMGGVGMKAHYYRGDKFISWQGDGPWFWQLEGYPSSHVIGGKAASKSEANKAARAKLDKLRSRQGQRPPMSFV